MGPNANVPCLVFVRIDKRCVSIYLSIRLCINLVLFLNDDDNPAAIALSAL